MNRFAKSSIISILALAILLVGDVAAADPSPKKEFSPLTASQADLLLQGIIQGRPVRLFTASPPAEVNAGLTSDYWKAAKVDLQASASVTLHLVNEASVAADQKSFDLGIEFLGSRVRFKHSLNSSGTGHNGTEMTFGITRNMASVVVGDGNTVRLLTNTYASPQDTEGLLVCLITSPPEEESADSDETPGAETPEAEISEPTPAPQNHYSLSAARFEALGVARAQYYSGRERGSAEVVLQVSPNLPEAPGFYDSAVSKEPIVDARYAPKEKSAMTPYNSETGTLGGIEARAVLNAATGFKLDAVKTDVIKVRDIAVELSALQTLGVTAEGDEARCYIVAHESINDRGYTKLSTEAPK